MRKPVTKHSTTLTNLLYRELNTETFTFHQAFRTLLLRQHAYLYDVGHFAARRRVFFFGVLAFAGGGLNVLGVGDFLNVLAAEAEVHAAADDDEGGQGEKDDHRHYFRVEAALVVQVVLVAAGGEERGEEEHLGQLGHHVDESGRHTLPEGAVLRPREDEKVPCF